MGKGATGLRSLHRKHDPDTIGRRTSCQPHCRETAKRAATVADQAEASSSEEPGAVIPHAGICEGAVG